ncbi:LacI family DNA-binding transcriptional regulator [Deinococcus roseus]|uniref:LacI family transcriptional regulator n=1 Tax=Deinococcus roseus TaxID=392414 RepID=A0ABQ2DA83_9DEIO|nr:LacI family DNA-binding transcriptional regulator [Deinococcus roseus]GGJ51066.1 LacI family transcriptional regulator [Deinococcus roseus]
MSKITINEVARIAGVSIGTVSRVLNNRADVNDQTRKQVLEVVRQLGYVPDAGARKLARGTRGLIAVAPFSSHASNSPYYAIIMDAIQEVLMQHGYTARVIEPSQADPSKVQAFIFPGLRLHDTRLEQLKEKGIPHVVIGRLTEQDIPWVDIDNFKGMQSAVMHLVKLGHTRIAHLTGSPIGQTTFDRLEAYHQTLSAHNIEENPDLILDGGFSELGGYRAVRQALEKGIEFTAIASASDEMAVGAIYALEDAGLRVPYDVSVTGFDDLEIAQVFRPALTTVKQPIREVGHSAAKILLDLLENRPADPIMLPTELVVRSSSGPVKRMVKR